MLKIFLCILLVALCTCAGIAFTRKHKYRKIFMYDLYSFNERLIGEVNYTRIPLLAFFDKYEYGTDFSSVLSGLKQRNFKNIKINFGYLTADEKKMAQDYFSMIGKSDARSQSNYLNAVREELEKEKNGTEAEYKKHFALYTKLGFLFGLILAILLV